MSTTRPNLDERIVALRTVIDAGAGRIPSTVTTEAQELVARAEQRRSRSAEHTVVGVFGATGSGKSSLVNALVGEEIAVAHVRRPTTSRPLAIAWDAAGAAELLDWLDIGERVERTTPIDPRASKIVLVDLPDVDSVESENRAIAQRLAEQVDVLVWVVDPQKYADDVLHAQFIAPHARHAAVTLIVLNQIDLLNAHDRAAVVSSLQSIVERGGLTRARILPVSARTLDGVDALRTAIGDLAASRTVRDARLTADIQTLAARIDDPGTAPRLNPKNAVALRDEVGVAAGVNVVASAVAGSYRKRAAQATGWPLVSWLGRFRVDPLSRLGLGPHRRGDNPDVHRTSMPVLSAGAQARLSMAVRSFADEASSNLAPSWKAAVRRTAEGTHGSLHPELDRAIAGTPLPARGSWWWPLVTVVQWVAVVAGLGGVLWLVGAALLPSFGLPALLIPSVEYGPLMGWPIPALVLIAALAIGVLLSVISGLLSGIIAAGRRRSARRRLLTSINEVVQRDVVGPISVVLDQARRVAAALETTRR